MLPVLSGLRIARILSALRAANADHPPPLLTKAEAGAEWAQALEKAVATRQRAKQ